jgi:signal transduction histidine kinase
MQHSVELASVLQHLVQIAATSSEPGMLLARVVMALGKSFQADGCMMAFSTSAQAGIQTASWIAASDLPTVSRLLAPSEHLTRRLSGSRAIAISDFQPGLEGKKPEQELTHLWQIATVSATMPPIGSLLEVTTQFQGAISGVVSLMRSRPYDWQSHEIEHLEIIAEQTAVIFSQLCLKQQLKCQFRYQTVINQLVMAIRRSSDLKDILRLATDDTAQALQAHRGLLLRLKYGEPMFRSASSEQLPKAKVSVICEWVGDTSEVAWLSAQLSTDSQLGGNSTLQESFWLSECVLCQQAFAHSPTPIVFDCRELSGNNHSSSVSPVFGLEATDSLLIAPLESQGTVLGFLVFQDRQSRFWSSEDIELVELVSAQVSTAIIQTETLRQVQSLVEKRTAELQHSLTVQARLYERTRQQVEQLRHLNQLKDEFLDTVSHELRTPLTSMALAIRMLRAVGTVSDRGSQYLDILEQQCAQETNLINDLLALRELESHQTSIQVEELNLVDLVKDLADVLAEKWSAKGLILQVDVAQDLLTIQGDRDSLNRILLELLTNAGKYSHPNSCIRLKMTYHQEMPMNQVILTLTNMGDGIAPEELPYIFDKFRRCRGANQKAIQGTGLGLALVKSLVQHLNGTISVSSAPTGTADFWETCFTLMLPQTLNCSL